MAPIIWYVIFFFLGGIVFRYFEEIIHFLNFMREDLARVREQTSKSIPINR